MNYAQAVVLAIVEGLTEFLPVSSTGHMIIASSVMGIAQESYTKTFTVAIQFGAILSVVLLYWKKFLPQGSDWAGMIRFYRRLIIAFIPAVIFGLLLKKYIDQLLENVIVVAVALLVGGIIFLFLDKWFKAAEERGEPELTNDGKAFRIGFFQVLAMVPGVSRSAATIIGGLTQGLNKKAAAEFSFFLAVPTMFAATVKDLWDFHHEGGGFTGDQLPVLVVGNLVAFVVAVLAIRSFIGYLTKHGFRVFGYYRILVGLAILVLHFLGIDLQMF
ncbi:MAG: undecaprenyl-diphosphate phosphatase [Bacteroidota bacterium]|jgi:undecaprenyl-diphosphatase|uniref:undecaprenyl-diphosphate phosphatase n=1 Tax=Candidatus Pollutiaquabacter sp. TaxID=3416354 RepID=UPI001A4BA860|nr:undecaprenyl-diphosphate phosphatase [Bacteroidota bacterium]MBL7948027.1 undecaprenyl-diphosphate phosphatase [Bacteroidia bacterium]MBP7268890.1 undecaprenyl-diphosphate phosphatase [Bacteroidia bacterium]MBP7727803.1 undecaprenyl-diphosphate phosphatase [Bacteroidia bacterium]MBP7771855.1 undecaprenyl-diphosphate phosphatase [Bacteroidia bacterium]